MFGRIWKEKMIKQPHSRLKEQLVERPGGTTAWRVLEKPGAQLGGLVWMTDRKLGSALINNNNNSKHSPDCFS